DACPAARPQLLQEVAHLAGAARLALQLAIAPGAHQHVSQRLFGGVDQVHVPSGVPGFVRAGYHGHGHAFHLRGADVLAHGDKDRPSAWCSARGTFGGPSRYAMSTATASLPSPAVAALVEARNHIAGQWTDTGDGTFLTVVDKYHGTELARIPHATSAQMDQAVAAAVKALPALRAMSAGDRSERLERLAAMLDAGSEELARLIMHEAGKPISYARVEIARCITTVRTAAAEALRLGGEVVPIDHGPGAGRTACTRRFPVGVVAAITPFNFPLNLVLHKLAPALAVGCPVVLKPAPQAPLSALALARMVAQLDYPVGTLSVLVCGVPVAEQLVTDERVAMLSFTGSDQVGWHLKRI